MLNGLKKFTSAVIALVIAFTVVGAFSRLNSNQVNADTTTPNTAQLTLSGKVRQKSYGNKNGKFSNGVLTLGKKAHCHALHATGTQGRLDFLPQHWR